MIRHTRKFTLIGGAVLAAAWLAGCGGGGGTLSDGVPTSNQSKASVRVHLPALPSTRATGGTLRADVSLFGAGMANAKKTSIPLNASAGNTVTFSGVAEGFKWAVALVWDEGGGSLTSKADRAVTGSPAALGITNVDVLSGQDNSATLSWHSPPDIGPTSIQRTYSLAGVAAPVSVLVVSDDPQSVGPQAFLLGAATQGVLLYGWIESFDVSSFSNDPQTPFVTVPLILSQPVAVLPAGATIGYKRETTTGLWLDVDDATMQLLAAAAPTLPAPAHGDIVGAARVYVRYDAVNGVTTPAGDFPNASLMDIRVSARSNPDVPVRLATDFGSTTYYAQGVGPVVSWVHRPAPGGVSDVIRILLAAQSGSAASPARAAAVPYALSNSYYPVELGHSWLWWSAELGAESSATTTTGS